MERQISQKYQVDTTGSQADSRVRQSDRLIRWPLTHTRQKRERKKEIVKERWSVHYHPGVKLNVPKMSLTYVY